jgi:hypothetical protein
MILIICLLTLISLLIFALSTLGIKFVLMRNEMSELTLRLALTEQKIINQSEIKDSPLEANEGFLRFISQSRDWAFQYIEEAQTAINNFVSNVEPIILYFDSYGDAGPQGPDHDMLKTISKEFKNLKEILPKEQ